MRLVPLIGTTRFIFININKLFITQQINSIKYIAYQITGIIIIQSSIGAGQELTRIRHNNSLGRIVRIHHICLRSFRESEIRQHQAASHSNSAILLDVFTIRIIISRFIVEVLSNDLGNIGEASCTGSTKNRAKEENSCLLLTNIIDHAFPHRAILIHIHISTDNGCTNRRMGAEALRKASILLFFREQHIEQAV